MDWALRLAREDDISELETLIEQSVRELQAPYYSTAQMEGALSTVFEVDRQLIRDGTYFAVCAAHFRKIELVATLAGVDFNCAFGYNARERYEVPLVNGLGLPVVPMTKSLTTSDD